VPPDDGLFPVPEASDDLSISARIAAASLGFTVATFWLPRLASRRCVGRMPKRSKILKIRCLRTCKSSARSTIAMRSWVRLDAVANEWREHIGRSEPGLRTAVRSTERTALPHNRSPHRSRQPHEDTHAWWPPRQVLLGRVSRLRVTRRILCCQGKLRTVLLFLLWSSFFNRAKGASASVPSSRSRVPRTNELLLCESYHLRGELSRRLAVFANDPCRRPTAIACDRESRDPRLCVRIAVMSLMSSKSTP